MTPSDLTDPELQKAAAAALPAIDAATQERDASSSDLKKLDAYLERSAARVEVVIPIPGGTGESVGWCRSGDRWRITYIAVGALVVRPLIDMPAAVRIRAQAGLPALLLAIAEALNRTLV